MLPEFLYHVTAKSNIPSIRNEGLRAGAYLSALDNLTHYYAETIKDEGQTPVTLKIATKDLDPTALEPDYHGIEEPILTVVRSHLGMGYNCDEDWIYGKWMESEQDFVSSLALIGSVRYASAISVESLNLGLRSTRNSDIEPSR
ncbi:hypothetical protein [Pseudomonas viridiflava]|uniref:hypothetical protein n=1 Tax=Pseudomonas viridiflava TaxID=33069 RepID=UPI000F014571|nr:hypothetical protein [Pseudomonas viridiflava]